MMEFKDLAFEVKAVDEDGTFEGHAAVFGNVDAYGDVIDPGAFRKTLKERPIVPVLWQHDIWEPIGASMAMVEDERGLAVTAKLALGVQRAREARELMGVPGALGGLSIGYETIKEERGERGDDFSRRLKEIKLWEFSPVTFPANELATVTAVKAALERAREGRVTLHDLALLAGAPADDEFRAELRSALGLDEKEGRTLSEPNRELLSRIADGLDDRGASIRALLAESEPPKGTREADDGAAPDELTPAFEATLLALRNLTTR